MIKKSQLRKGGKARRIKESKEEEKGGEGRESITNS